MAAGRQADGPPGTPAGPRGGAGGGVQHRATRTGVSTFREKLGKVAAWGDEVKW